MILVDHDVCKLALPFGIPGTGDDLHSVICETFGIAGDFSVLYKDVDFGDEHFTMCSKTDIKDRDTIKVVFILEPPTVALTLVDVTNVTDDGVERFEQSSGDHLIWINQ